MGVPVAVSQEAESKEAVAQEVGASDTAKLAVSMVAAIRVVGEMAALLVAAARVLLAVPTEVASEAEGYSARVE
eukprot:6193888-Pleurochrysis_carterae.AAC.6